MNPFSRLPRRNGQRFGQGKRALPPDQVQRVLELRGSGLSMAAVARETGVNPKTVKRLWEQQEPIQATLERLGKEALGHDPAFRERLWHMQLQAIVNRQAEAAAVPRDGTVQLQLSRRLMALVRRYAREHGGSVEQVITEAVWFALVVAADWAEEDEEEDDGEDEGDQDDEPED